MARGRELEPEAAIWDGCSYSGPSATTDGSAISIDCCHPQDLPLAPGSWRCSIGAIVQLFSPAMASKYASDDVVCRRHRRSHKQRLGRVAQKTQRASWSPPSKHLAMHYHSPRRTSRQWSDHTTNPDGAQGESEKSGLPGVWPTHWSLASALPARYADGNWFHIWCRTQPCHFLIERCWLWICYEHFIRLCSHAYVWSRHLLI